MRGGRDHDSLHRTPSDRPPLRSVLAVAERARRGVFRRAGSVLGRHRAAPAVARRRRRAGCRARRRAHCRGVGASSLPRLALQSRPGGHCCCGCGWGRTGCGGSATSWWRRGCSDVVVICHWRSEGDQEWQGRSWCIVVTRRKTRRRCYLRSAAAGGGSSKSREAPADRRSQDCLNSVAVPPQASGKRESGQEKRLGERPSGKRQESFRKASGTRQESVRRASGKRRLRESGWESVGKASVGKASRKRLGKRQEIVGGGKASGGKASGKRPASGGASVIAPPRPPAPDAPLLARDLTAAPPLLPRYTTRP